MIKQRYPVGYKFKRRNKMNKRIATVTVESYDPGDDTYTVKWIYSDNSVGVSSWWNERDIEECEPINRVHKLLYWNTK